MHNEGTMRLYRDFIGGSERSTPPNPQETPRKPPGNPQVTPSIHRTDGSKIVQLYRPLGEAVTSIKNRRWRIIHLYIKQYIVPDT